jgi:predicted phosphohydrolase
MSDIHNQYSRISVPDGNIFVFAGDFSIYGNESEMPYFAAFLAGLPHKYKVVIAGNHD